MTGPRLLQNFRGLAALVAAPTVPDGLALGLARLGLHLTHLPDPTRPADVDAERHVILLDADQPQAPQAIASLQAGESRAPMVGMIGLETPGRLRMLFEAGATGLLRKPVQAGALYSTLYLAVNAHRQRAESERRLADHDRRRRGRRFVISAVLRMTQREAIDEDAAYEVLRRAAMRSRLGIEAFCEAWLQTETESLSPTPRKRDHG